MTMSVRFCLLYDPLKWDFFAFKMNIISIQERIADMDIFSNLMSLCQSVITLMVIQFLCKMMSTGYQSRSRRFYPPLYQSLVEYPLHTANLLIGPELQIRGGTEKNLKIFFLISQQKPMLSR